MSGCQVYTLDKQGLSILQCCMVAKVVDWKEVAGTERKGEGEMEAAPGSVMERLSRVHDARRRQGKRYRLPGVMGMLVLAALHGESSLRGMWLWAQGQWERIAEPLDLWGNAGPPAYGTLWELLAHVDIEELSQALYVAHQAEADDACTVDGKVLRGSRRAAEPALQVVTVAGQNYGRILAQEKVEAGDSLEAAIHLLQGMPLQGKIVTLDAGLLQREVVKVIDEKGGPTSGL